MKALFILKDSDPEEVFQMMDETRHRILQSGGTCTVRVNYDVINDVNIHEYRFECSDIKQLIG